MEEEKIIQLLAVEGSFFAGLKSGFFVLTNKGRIFAANMNNSGHWEEISEYPKF